MSVNVGGNPVAFVSLSHAKAVPSNQVLEMASIKTIDGTPTDGANPWIDSLVWGGAWTSSGPKVTISYALKSGIDPNQTSDPATGKIWADIETAAMRKALAAWESVANVDFVEKSATSRGTDMWFWLFDNETMDKDFGYSEVPDPASGPVEPLYLGLNWQVSEWNNDSLQRGGFSYAVMLHELGHALGLAHPHDGGTQFDKTVFPGVTEDFDDYGDDNLNQGIFTVMSYNDGWPQRYPGHNQTYYGTQATPMAFDVAAIQKIYGANMSYHKGDNTYYLPNKNTAGTFWSCIWDAGGNDSISAGKISVAVTIHLGQAPLVGVNAGGYVSKAQGIKGGYTIAKGVVIENAYGGNGADKIIGNSAANYLSGKAGNDRLYGGKGNDTLSGGLGDNKLDGDSGSDTATYSKLSVSINASLTRNTALVTGQSVEDTFVSIENLTGGSGSDILTGNAGVNFLRGGAGNDKLASSSGNDTLSGGLGNDTLDGGSGSDTATYSKLTVAINASLTRTTSLSNSQAGKDKFVSIENLTGGSGSDTLTGDGRANILQGSAGNDKLDGAGGADTISGGAGNDRIDGGSGADDTRGGVGNDTYIVQNTGDKITEAAGSGIDTVTSSVSVSSSAADVGVAAYIGSHVEKISLTGLASINVKANALDNIITGNVGDNHLRGAAGNDKINGGGGSDKLSGGQGADMFYFTSALVMGSADTLSDFTSGEDQIVLDRTMIFQSLNPSAQLLASEFAVGAMALDGNDFVIFDAATRKLFYDPDGNGTQTATHVATLEPFTATLAATDFMLI